MARGPFGGDQRASLWEVACEVALEAEGTLAGSHARRPGLPGPVLATWFVQGEVSSGAGGGAESPESSHVQDETTPPTGRTGRGGHAHAEGSGRGV